MDCVDFGSDVLLYDTHYVAVVCCKNIYGFPGSLICISNNIIKCTEYRDCQ